MSTGAGAMESAVRAGSSSRRAVAAATAAAALGALLTLTVAVLDDRPPAPWNS